MQADHVPDQIVKLFADMGEPVPASIERRSGSRLPVGAYVGVDGGLIWVRSSGLSIPSGSPQRLWRVAGATNGVVNLSGEPLDVVRRLRPPVAVGRVVPAWMVPPRSVVYAVETGHVVCRFTDRGEVAVFAECAPDCVTLDTSKGIWPWRNHWIGNSTHAAGVVMALDVADFAETCKSLTGLTRELRFVSVAGRLYQDAVKHRHGYDVSLADVHRWCAMSEETGPDWLPSATYEDGDRAAPWTWAFGDLDGEVRVHGAATTRLAGACVLAAAAKAMASAGPVDKRLWSGSPRLGILSENLAPATSLTDSQIGGRSCKSILLTSGEAALVPAGVGRVCHRDRSWLMVERPYVIGYASRENRELWKAEVTAKLARDGVSAFVPDFAPITPIVSVFRVGADGSPPELPALDAAPATS